ncbi:adhesion G-protein coupled receptor F3 [Dipodomys spectabilis]|uniref:adhesion G-protein coupled receptor F3 n=1 Tax=Dipodomys spectabilis TaxID=105255 RepID=UPI001C5461A5|nr:adhesion G-protein coupled receptor F3 [Dipodomys spectabilis]
MVCPAVPRLLLAMTLSLLPSPIIPTSQPEQSQAGGEPLQQLDRDNGAEESVLVSIYVHLEFPDRIWPPALSRPLVLPAASASSSPRTLTGLHLTTECNANSTGHSHCTCRPGYQWNNTVCSQHVLCDHHLQPCKCLIFHHSVPGHCQLLPPGASVSCFPTVPGKLSLRSPLQRPGNTLNLMLLTNQPATHVKWFLKRPRSSTPIILQSGTQVSLTSSQGQAALSITHMSHHWAGEYLSVFEAQEFTWRLNHTVEVPLQKTDVAQLPDQLSVSCATSPGFQLSCCVPATNLVYTAAWSPMEGSQASSHNTAGSQCLVLAVQHCPAADTTYTCVLKSQGLAPLSIPVSVTIIRDGDTTCPDDFSEIAWNVTKAGHIAQASCPANKKGMVKRPCGPNGTWGPIQSNCIDKRILALCAKARLLQAGQGNPGVEVPWILKQLQTLVAVASSPSDLRELLSTVTVLAEVVARARVQLDSTVLQDLLVTTDKVLDMNTSALVPLWPLAQAQKPSMASDFLLAVETLVRSLCPQDHPFFFNSSNVLLQSHHFGPPFPDDYQISFSTWPLLQAQISRHSLAPLIHAATNISITSLVLQKLDHFLPPNYGPGLKDSPYGTPGLVLVISIMADGEAFTKAEVIMDFGDPDSTLHCVFWDHHLFQGNGGWSEKGCQAKATSASPTARCICKHLTSFSILMSRNIVPESPILELLTKMGLGASILALLVCLGVYRLVWRAVVRNKVAFFRHIALFNMVICLLVADTCFLGDTLFHLEFCSPLCLASTFLCHYFYLATFFWMLAQSLMLAHQLLFVFHHLSKHIVLFMMVTTGYLCPLGFAGVALGLYLPQGLYLWEGRCWLNVKGVGLYTFAGPVLAIVGVNGIVLAIVVLKLLRPSLSEGPPMEKHQALLGVLKALLILTPIFGLTWGFGIAIILEEVSIVPHYIFTVLNSLQGVFILVFGCLSDKKVQEALRKHFCRTRFPNSAITLTTNETSIWNTAKVEVKKR